MTGHLRSMGFVVATFLCATAVCWAQADPATGSPAPSCEALARQDSSGVGHALILGEAPTQIISAQRVEAKGGRSAYCRIQGYVWPQVGIELQLPIGGWNQKLIEFGCLGACGRVGIGDSCPAGFACIESDSGHTGAALDGLWASNNLQAQVDYGYRAAHVTALAGKAMVERFYGNAPQHSYFSGGSTGGRQALVEAQRFPWDFDGIIAVAPWIEDTESTMEMVWAVRALKGKDGSLLLSHADLELVHSAALAACDLDDGVQDGIISNPLACKFDPANLMDQSADLKGHRARANVSEPRTDTYSKDQRDVADPSFKHAHRSRGAPPRSTHSRAVSTT